MQVPKHLQLLLSGVVVLLAGLVYGIYPSKIVPFVLGFEVEVLELKNIFRAIMGIYLGLGIFWLMGAFNEKLWRPATVCNVLFMGGISFGRIVSLLVDGYSSLFLQALILEFLFMCWGLYNLKTYN